MKIAIDPWTLARRFRFQGTYVYARKVLEEFKKIGATRDDLEFCLFTPPGEANDPRLIGEGPGFQLRESSLAGQDAAWRMGGLGWSAKKAGADVVFAPTGSSLPWGPVPMVCTIHDLTPVVMPEHASGASVFRRVLLRTIARQSRDVITISEWSKKDLMRLYGIPETKISVIYIGLDESVFNTEAPAAERKAELLKKLGLKRPFIMHHGTIQPRKNLVRLIAAYRLLLARNPNADFDLALPGPMGWKYDEIVAAAQGQTGMRGRVLLTGAVGTEELAVLLKSAALMVVPSLYEGFCMPMVEAMACGTPVIASSTSCLPEISGKQLLYFDPTSVEEMAVAMEKALFDSDVRTGLQERGPKRAAAFSWERCAAETLSVLLRGGKEGLRA